jgi:hypothetical protein
LSASAPHHCQNIVQGICGHGISEQAAFWVATVLVNVLTFVLDFRDQVWDACEGAFWQHL